MEELKIRYKDLLKDPDANSKEISMLKSEILAIEAKGKICQVVFNDKKHRVAFGKVIGYVRKEKSIVLKLEPINKFYEIRDIIGRNKNDVKFTGYPIYYDGITGKKFLNSTIK